jgi:hypothetical protein
MIYYAATDAGLFCVSVCFIPPHFPASLSQKVFRNHGVSDNLFARHLPPDRKKAEIFR